MDNLSAKFVEKLHKMSDESLPDRVLEKARECFTDYLFVTIAGSKRYESIHEAFLTENKLSGFCHIIGSPQTADFRTAAMINAFNAHVLELDDSHRAAMTHLGATIFSALISAAEVYDVSLERLLHAAVVGYEAAIRTANAIQPGHKKRGFHVSGTCCTIGCAMGVAALLRFSVTDMQNALSAAATSAAGLLGVSSGKSEQKPYNTANAAAAGVTAALYGKLFSGGTDILNGPRGFFEAFTDRCAPERLFDEGYAIETIYQKLYAACRHCHAPMEAMLTIGKKSGISAEDVDEITVRTYDLAIGGHDHTDITGTSSAKQSIPYGVAAACLFGDCGMDAFTEERVSDKNVLELTKKVRILEDRALSALVPSKRAAIVAVRLSDGTTYEQRVDYPKGEPENPISAEEFENKFLHLAESAGMQRTKYYRLKDFIHSGEQEPVKTLFELL